MSKNDSLVRVTAFIKPEDLLAESTHLLFSGDYSNNALHEDKIISALSKTDIYPRRLAVRDKNIILYCTYLFGPQPFSNFENPEFCESYRARIPLLARLCVGTLKFDRVNGRNVGDYSYTFRQDL